MAGLKLEGVFTSTIGSFPLDDSDANRGRCIEDLLTLGIDFPVYPQLQDMGRQFLRDLAEQDDRIATEGGRYRLRGREIRQDVAPPGLEPFFWTLRYLEEKGVKEKAGLKAAVTGPFTLASYIEIGAGAFPSNTAVSDLELVNQLARVLFRSCETVSKDANMISIDEPVLGMLVGSKIALGYSEKDIVDIYNDLAKSCRGRFVGTHICGRISPRLAKILLKTDLSFLSHEFYDTRGNIDVYSPKEVRQSGKVLSVGCVSSRSLALESPEEILAVMLRFREYGDTLFFTPDCGFRNLVANGSKEKGYKISLKKLENMVRATEKFRAAE